MTAPSRSGKVGDPAGPQTVRIQWIAIAAGLAAAWLWIAFAQLLGQTLAGEAGGRQIAGAEIADAYVAATSRALRAAVRPAVRPAGTGSGTHSSAQTHPRRQPRPPAQPRPLAVVYTAMHGVGSEITRRVLAELEAGRAHAV